MGIVHRWIKRLRWFVLGWAIAMAIASCNGLGLLSDTDPWPQVASLPLPELPAWIEQISPTGEAAALAQIRIRFTAPLIPLEELESPDQQDALAKFELVPPLPGQFRFLTPRMVGFQADQALPLATRMQVTLKAGLADLNNHRLDQDLAWTFNTPAIQLTNLPGPDSRWQGESAPVTLKPALELTSNVELDLDSLREHLMLIPQGAQRSVALDVVLKEKDGAAPSDYSAPQERFDPSQRPWIYTFMPRRDLDRATRYQIDVTAGLRPAHGNLPTATAFTSQVETYGPLTFEDIQYWGQPDAGGAYGRFVEGAAQLRFNNGLMAESVLENITVEPPPKESPRLVRTYDGDTLISLNPWALEPATRYTITLGAGLQDQYGQTLAQPVTVQYETGNVAADLWAPSGLNIFPMGKDLQLNISAVNLPQSQFKAAYRVVQPQDLVYTDSAYPRGDRRDLLPNPSTWETFPIPTEMNQSADVAVPLGQQLGQDTGLLAYGVQARANRYQMDGQEGWREPTFYGLVELTNLGVFAQWFPESGLVRVHHLSDGAAVGGATIEIYQSLLDAETVEGRPSPCASGTTDGTGLLRLDAAALQGCMAGGSSFSDPPQLLTVAREGADWAFVRTLDYSGGYSYGIYAGWDGDRPQSRGTVFSDRQLYKPGETAWFTAAAYYLQNGTLQQDKAVAYRLTVEDPNGQSIDLGSHTTNDFGTLSLQWEIPTTQPLGYYTIHARKGDEADPELDIAGEFRVAEFKPPNFQVEASLNRTIAQVGDQVAVTAQSNYLFGPPVQGGRASYYITREQADFVPPGWERFSFGRQWFWPEERPAVSSDVRQVTAELDDQGQSQETVTVADDLPYAMTYRVDVDVTDVSNLSVADTKMFTALPGDRLIGLQSNFVADAGQPFPVQVIVTDPEGKAIGGQRLRVELQQMTYSSVTQVIEGSPTPRDQVEYTTVDQAEVRSGAAPQTISLTPSESGSYRIRANLSNASSDVTATDSQIWATGPAPAYWGGRYGNERLELQLDKDRYQPGETATVLIQSPYPEAELYFAVVRHDVLYATTTKVQGGAPQIQFEVTADMLPNAAVEAVLVRQGPPLDQVDADNADNLNELVRIGFAPFATELGDKYLTVTETVQAPSLLPGAEQTVELALTNVQGQPVQGQITLMVVNEAVLQLTGYRPPDLVETVYAEQAISTRFADNRPDVVLQPLASPIEKGWGYGGGLSAGAGSTRIRTDFQPLAYYNGSVLTDASGRAEVSFTLPDDLTTWRVMAIATDGNFRFGQGDATFITTKPLMANAILPQFVRSGDRFLAGLSLTNATGQRGRLTINGEVADGLAFGDTDRPQPTQQLQTNAPEATTAYRFSLVANQAGTAQVQFSAQLGDQTDAFAVPLEIRSLAVTEQVVETGTTDSQVTLPLQIGENVAEDLGGLELALASTLIPELTAPAQQVLGSEQLPFLEPAASRLAIAANLHSLSRQYGQSFADFSPVPQAIQALEQLQKLQQPDGGFAAWPQQEQSDPFVTPYVAQAIARAAQAFADTPAAVPSQTLVNRLKTYLADILADPGQYDYCQEAQCQLPVRLEALMALAELGDPRADFLAELYAGRDQLSAVRQVKLARYLSQLPAWQQQAASLSSQIQETIYETGRAAAVNIPQGWGWLDSATATQAQALRLYVARQSPADQLDRLLQSLLNLRRDGTWSTTYDNAEALTAQVDYSQISPTPPSFTATATLADEQLASAQFEGYQNPSLSLQVPMAELPRGQQNLVLQKTGQGTLHYLAAYRYRPQGNLAGRLNGLRVTREIRPVNQADVLQRMGLRPVDDAVTLAAGQVFDIGLEIIADHPIDHLVITDPLPAGLEAIDASFQTAISALQAQPDSWQISYQTIHSDRVEAYGDRLDAGVYSLHYLARTVTPGRFIWPGTEVHLQYAPEEFGRAAAATLEIEE